MISLIFLFGCQQERQNERLDKKNGGEISQSKVDSEKADIQNKKPEIKIGRQFPFSYYTPYSELHPLPSATVYNSVQDNLGYMWFCIYGSGIIRYDGQTMDLYTEADGILGNTIMCALQDHQGRLWVASDLGVCLTEKPLGKYSIGERIKFTNKLYNGSLAKTSISQVAPNCLSLDKNGNVYVATTGFGVIKYNFSDGKNLKVDTLRTELKKNGLNSTVYVVCSTKDGKTWAGVEGGLMLLKPGEKYFNEYPKTSNFTFSNIHALAEMSDGSLWGGCENGLIWKLEEFQSNKRFVQITQSMKGIVYQLQENPQGTVSAVSYNSGVMEINLKDYSVEKTFTRDNGLLGNNIRNLIFDREGNMWFLGVGISKLQKNFEAFRLISTNSVPGKKSLLPVPVVNGIDAPNETHSSLWVCTDAGVVEITPDGNSETIDVSKGLSNNTTYDVHVDKKNRVWIGTFSGLNCITFDQEQVPPFNTGITKPINVNGKRGRLSFYDLGIIGVCNSSNIFGDSAFSVSKEAMWFNSYRSVVCLVDNEWFVFNEKAGLPSSIMYSLTVDKSGYVYVGTGDKGLYRSIKPLTLSELRKNLSTGNGMAGREINKTLFKPYWNISLGAPSNEFQELIWIDNSLWVGTSNAVYVLENGLTSSVIQVQPASGKKNVGGYSGAYNPVTKTVWFGFTSGLEEIDPVTKKVVRVITKEDGLLSNEVNWLEGIDIDKAGNIYIANPNGISIYQPALDVKNVIPPEIVFNNATFSEGVSGNNELKIKYAALSYANEKLIRYRTRLIGYNNEWSEPTIETSFRYMNLSAYFFKKEYVFEVIACNNSGVWNKTPLKYSFYVSPPLWFNWWAFLIYVAGAFGLVRLSKYISENLRIIIENRKSRYISHYKLNEILGIGGMGKVFKATDNRNKKIVAIKVLNPHLLKDEENRKRLQSEGRLLSSLNNPNVVKVFEFGDTEEHTFIAMEYISNGTLQNYIEKNNPLDINEAIDFAKQICSGLAEIHSRQIVHRDLKSPNIMLDENKNLRIMDFGLSKSPLVTTMTSLGTVIGTLGFVAPEQVTNLQVDQRVDIFSFGIIFYQMLTNRLPFTGENEIALIHSIFNTKPEAPSKINIRVPQEVDRIVFKCIAKDVNERYNSAADILNDINSLRLENGIN